MRFYTSGDPEEFKSLLPVLLGEVGKSKKSNGWAILLFLWKKNKPSLRVREMAYSYLEDHLLKSPGQHQAEDGDQHTQV